MRCVALAAVLLAFSCSSCVGPPAGRLSQERTQSTVSSPAGGSALFTDITAAAGIDFRHQSSKTAQKYMVEAMGSGCAFIDYDRDGFLDILFLNGAPLPGGHVSGHPTLKLYHNNHDGTFTDVTHKAGLDKTMYAMGCAVGDYDNDGYDDLYITCVLGPSHLFHNNGNGTFTDVTEKAGVANTGGWGTSCAWMDVDNDGYLDLLVCNYVQYRSLKDDMPCYAPGGRLTYCIPIAYRPSHCVLYHNNGNGTFTDISASSGIGRAAGKSLGVAIWDYDHDGLPDIYVTNDGTPGFLFHNLGHNRFEEIGIRAGIAFDDQGNPHSGMGVDVADLYDDGKSSVVITDFSGQETSLYDETSPGTYRDDRTVSGVGPPSRTTLGFGALFFDYDNDGYPDIFVLNGHVQDDIRLLQPEVQYAEPPFLFHNGPDHRFQDVAPTSGGPLTQRMVGRGAAWGDYDNDGRLDLLVSTNGGPAYLWHNETPNPGHWITLRLIGTKSNRDGIGAVITTLANGLTQTTMVRSGSSYLSASDLRAHIGLGNATAADISVRWPSGTVDSLRAVHADHFWTLREGAGSVQ